MADDLRRLIKRCLGGDQQAMIEFVDRFRGRVFGLCYRMLGCREDAEDMAQETFLRALRNLARWDPQRDFEPWLLAIAGNRCRTLLATRKRRPSSFSLLEPLPDPSPDYSAARHLAEELELVMADMREEYRQAFLLFHEQELSYPEIAAALDCPVGTIKTWVHRARKEMIGKLQERGVFEDARYAVRRV